MEKTVITRAEIISFGCLKKVLVQPDGGINLLSMPNESGKTTFAAFVKFVLYGFSGGRMSSVAENEKKRFMPWDGGNAEGVLEITQGDRHYRITRTASAQARDKVTCVLLPSGEKVFENRVPGEAVFGVGEELFTKTAFFRELQMPQGSDAELASELKNISVGAAERAAYERAQKKLTEAKNELANRQKHGIYYDVKARLEDTRRKYETALNVTSELGMADEKIKSCAKIISDDDAALARLADEMGKIEAFEAHTALTRLQQFDSAEEKAKAEYDAAVENFNLEGTQDGELFKTLSEKYNEYAALKAEKSVCDRNLASCEMAIAEKQKSAVFDAQSFAVAKRALLFGRISPLWLLLAAALLAAGIIMQRLPMFFAAAAACLLGMIAFAAALISCRKFGFKKLSAFKKAVAEYPSRIAQFKSLWNTREEASAASAAADKKAAEAAAEIEKGIAMCCRPDPSLSLSQQLEDMRYAFSRAQSLNNTYLAASDARQKAYAGVDTARLSALASSFDGNTPRRDRKTVEHETAFYRQQKEKITAKLYELNQSRAVLLSTSGDAALLKGKADALEARLKKIEQREKALAVAIDTLGAAGEYIRSSVAPLINESAGKYFYALTSGKYVTLDAGSELKLTAGDGFTTHECDALSAGARECAYISLRLALSDIMYPDAAVPIFFDDAFVHLDDDRLQSMMRLLGDTQKNHQIFIISCSSRDIRALKESGVPYSGMELKQC